MGTQHTVLWAEDEPFHIGLVREVVKKNYADIFLAEAINGREALSFLDDALGLNVVPQLIVLDINMPDLDGRKTLINMLTRQALKNIPKVLFSSSNSLLDKLFAARYQVPLVHKSYNEAECKKAIAGILNTCMSLQKKVTA